jgi:NADH-quinone oxidoreductase subunit L
MFRLVYLTFFGDFRGTHEQEHHVHESPPTMTVPLVVLAFLSVVGGAILGWPHHHFLAHWLAPIFPELHGVPEAQYEISANLEYALMFVSSAIAAIGTWLAYTRFYKRGLAADESFAASSPAIARGMENKWYVDEFYGKVVVRPLERISMFSWRVIDAIIAGIAAMLGYIVAGIGDLLRFFQTGNVRNYALMFFAGVVLFIWMYV